MSDRSYSWADQLLHRLTLAWPMVSEAAFDLEKSIHGNGLGDTGHHVFVAGLARAGTTLLLRLLHQSGEFASLTYRDMPLVLAPNIWSRIARLDRQEMAPQERAHGDGMLVDFDSPEALEEVFWRVMAGRQYIRADRLVPALVSSDVLEDFRTYVGLILKRYGRSRYLSKNNNNILRLPSIAESFPSALILVPIRDPLQQAHSLLRQHARFKASDAFTTDYMRWLAHFEFGRSHRPFVFNKELPTGEPTSIDYWLSMWVSVYEGIASRVSSLPNCIFVPYEIVCAKPHAILPAIYVKVGLAVSVESAIASVRATHEDDIGPLDPVLARRAADIYDDLSRRGLRSLGLGA